jgi:hypothetical protein
VSEFFEERDRKVDRGTIQEIRTRTVMESKSARLKVKAVVAHHGLEQAIRMYSPQGVDVRKVLQMLLEDEEDSTS